VTVLKKMSQNPEVKLARHTELAFTEAHLTDLKPESCMYIALFLCFAGSSRAASHGSFSCSFSACDSDLRVFLSKSR